MTERSFLRQTLELLPSLRREGRRLTGCWAAADDLVQDTVARALERRSQLKDPQRLKAWLFAVQRSVFLNSRRGRAPRLEVLEGGLTANARREPQSDLEEELLSATLGSEMKAALEALPAEWRDALWLREVEELTYEEIAAVQGCPVGTVRSRLARARLAMLRTLNEEKKHGHL